MKRNQAESEAKRIFETCAFDCVEPVGNGKQWRVRVYDDKYGFAGDYFAIESATQLLSDSNIRDEVRQAMKRNNMVER